MRLLLQTPLTAPAVLPVAKSSSPREGTVLHRRPSAASASSSLHASGQTHERFLRGSPSLLWEHDAAKRVIARAAPAEVGTSSLPLEMAQKDVLTALSQIIDPDFGTDIVSCGFVKDLHIDEAFEEVSFRLELTTPACPIKDMFEQRANEVVAALPWVKKVNVTMSAQPARPIYEGQLPMCLQSVSNIIAVSSCKVVPLTAAVIVTTPQKLAFIDVAKGVRMFSKLKVPCVAVVENMCYFDADGKRYYPFGEGSGSQVVQQFGIPHLFDLPIRPSLSAAGDSGIPEVVADPLGEVSQTFQNLGVCVVQQCAKIRQQVSTAVAYDKSLKAIRVKVPDSEEEFLLHPATVRRNDRSAQSVDEWTGEQKLQYGDVPEEIEPEDIRPMGNYAVSITWPDGFSQIAPYDQLQMIERLVDVPQPVAAQANT